VKNEPFGLLNCLTVRSRNIYESLPLMTTYRGADALWKHNARIEQTLFPRIMDLFGFSTTITLYDLTNTYFEGEVPHNTKARNGRSQEKRSDCPLVTLGLVLDGSGFVRCSQTFAGNASDSQVLWRTCSKAWTLRRVPWW
jgi:hypothetical protein